MEGVSSSVIQLSNVCLVTVIWNCRVATKRSCNQTTYRQKVGRILEGHKKQGNVTAQDEKAINVKVLQVSKK